MFVQHPVSSELKSGFSIFISVTITVTSPGQHSKAPHMMIFVPCLSILGSDVLAFFNIAVPFLFVG